MKLRIKGNSLRLRVSRSEMETLVKSGIIEDTIHFAVGPEAKFTYALRHASAASTIHVEYLPQHVAVVLSTEAAKLWAASDQVGIYGSSETAAGPLEIFVEKDFACLDGENPLDDDAFPNPNAESAC